MGFKLQKEKRSMEHFAGLDVSVNEKSVCIDTGVVVLEVKVASEPEALLSLLRSPADVQCTGTSLKQSSCRETSSRDELLDAVI